MKYTVEDLHRTRCIWINKKGQSKNPFLSFLFDNLHGMMLWESDTLTVPLYMCAGVAYVVKEKGFHSAYQLAEECCDSAKKAAKKEKNFRNGLAGNWIDFQVRDTTNTQELDFLREKSYVTKDQIHMQMRPYCLDSEVKDEPVSYFKFIERVHRLQKAKLTRQQQEALHLSYMMGRQEFRRWIQYSQSNGLDLTSLLGDAMHRDEDGQMHALWFDAVEMMNFIPE